MHPHPLHLPEVLGLFGPFLSAESLACCILVNQQWHSVFMPHLWHTVCVSAQFAHEPYILSNLALHAHLVQYLDYGIDGDAHEQPFFGLNFPRLRSLTLYSHGSQPTLGQILWRRHIDHIQTLNIQNAFELHSGFFKRVQPGAFCALKSLTLAKGSLLFEDMDNDVRDLFCQLDSLDLRLVTLSEVDIHTRPNYTPQWEFMTGSGNHAAERRSPHIRHLSLTSCRSLADEFHLIKECRQLESLEWRDIRRRTVPPKSFVRVNGMCPFLEKLHLTIEFQDEDLALFLGGLTCPLRELSVVGSLFGDQSAQALLDASGPNGEKKHSGRLEKLSWIDKGATSGEMIQRIMCECPKLKEFQARLITDLDLKKDPRPWVCTDLRSLSITLALAMNDHDNDDDSDDKSLAISPFFDRLATLTRLDTLVLFNMARSGRNGEIEEAACRDHKFKLMEINLEKGLDRLNTLKSLRLFKMELAEPNTFFAEEALWMVQHWPRLDRINIAKVQDADREEIQNVFKTSWVQCNFSNFW